MAKTFIYEPVTAKNFFTSRDLIGPIGVCMMACSRSVLVKRQVAAMSAYANMATSYKAFRMKVISKLYKNRRGFWKRKRCRKYVIHG